jgi:5-hydroxyisourate hydrolase
MISISTHVLDTARGAPAKDVPVYLELQERSGQWRQVGSARTGADGRCTQLVGEGEKLAPGVYRLMFDTETYHAAQGIRGLYPAVHVTFHARDGEAHYHIPLLLSPYGYTTYRGS